MSYRETNQPQLIKPDVPNVEIRHDSPRILVLYGSLREQSYSRFWAVEAARSIESLGFQVCIYDPRGLPVKDPELDDHPKLKELLELSLWSECQVSPCPEIYGTITGVFKN